MKARRKQKPVTKASTDANSHRDARGRFLTGCPSGPGNPYCTRVAELKRLLLAAVTREDIEKIARMLIDQAREGNLNAVRELMDRCLGKAAPAAFEVDGVDKYLDDLVEGKLPADDAALEKAVVRALTNRGWSVTPPKGCE